ncbi:Membrane protein related to metalloendopeptidase [Magnetospirillum sp. LM-5]|nr:Membrane protein related to metalloendopeptidase [Magnetospirillum sp. LM-5]
MVDRKLGLIARGKNSKIAKRLAAQILPEWQVFVRRPDGSAEHFTVTRKRQLMLVASVAALAFWAGTATTLLTRQPDELAAKERTLEEMMASYRAAQHRLNSAERLVGDIAREVDTVHTNLKTLAESNDALAKDRPGKGAPALARGRVVPEPAYDEKGQPGANEAGAVRDQVRELEASLERLRNTSVKAIEKTSDAAGSRIAETEKQISKLGLDPARVLSQAKRSPGLGGPFIPAPAGAVEDVSMGALVERMAQWKGVKATLQRLPLAEPIRGGYEFNSGFGTRNDPLNNRSGIHEGVDLGAPIGTPVYAAGDGIITLAEPWDRYGNTVEIDHGNGISSRYAHLSRIKVKDGQKVTRSTVIGLVGNSGRSTGAHLHYEVRVNNAPKDPVKFISAGRDVPKAR